MIRCVFVFPWYEWGMGFKKNMKGQPPPVQAPKVETVSAGESEHAAKRSLLEEQRRRRGRVLILLASEVERQYGGAASGKRETLG